MDTENTRLSIPEHIGARAKISKIDTSERPYQLDCSHVWLYPADVEEAPAQEAEVPVSSEATAKANALEFAPPPREAPEAEPKATAACVEEEEEESEWETDDGEEDEIFKRANPDRKLRRRDDNVDPWCDVFKWIAAVVKHSLERNGAETKALRTLVGDGVVAAELTPELLADGKALCALMIALRPDVLKKPIPNAMGRLGQVQKACKQLGIRDSDLFVPSDIMNVPPPNPNAVLRCITALAGIAEGWEDYRGPKLRRVKRR
jgi:hypothetical protein